MNAASNNHQAKVLFAADVGGYSVNALDLACRMAAALRAPLRGLFVEDEDLLQLTGLPITREISLMTAGERPTDVAQMQRAMRSQAGQFEASLRREASALQIGCSFEYVRGRVRDIGLRPDSSITYTIIEQGGQLGSRLRTRRLPRRLLWILQDPAREIPALRVLLESSARHQIELIIVGDAAEIEAIDELEQWTQDPDYRVRVERWDPSRLEQQMASRPLAFDCAVISRREKPERVVPILKSLSCPVVLVA